MRRLAPGRLLPLLGSMGMVLPLGLGVALGRTGRVTAVEGDGGLLMCLGSLSTIASQAPPNLLCIILDNNGYRTTGGQPTTLEPGGGIVRLLIASGFTNVRTVSTLEDLKDALDWGCEPGLRAIVCLTCDPAHAPPAPACNPRSLAREFARSTHLG
ncbi:thiamine pyrophosphate-dependent enzyme [Kocuria salsicia]|uniref:thiamine pyrophosphate-dependent enzyme n=1 Tax=Kocuria salsicia TaxID=664639 RepID=UPI003CC8310B